MLKNSLLNFVWFRAAGDGAVIRPGIPMHSASKRQRNFSRQNTSTSSAVAR